MAISTITHKNSLYEISYEIKNIDKESAILFLHGWGSNKNVMKISFENFFSNFKHIYIDMPGFGKSETDEILNTETYVSIVESFIKTMGFEADIIFGHSYGGKIATLMKPKYLILLSSAGILEEKSSSVKMKITLTKILNSLGLSFLSNIFKSKDVYGMSDNMYQTFKNVVDEDFEEVFKDTKSETIIFWGKEDKATSLASGEKIHSLIKNSKFFPMDGDHYFFMNNGNEIEKTLLNIIK